MRRAGVIADEFLAEYTADRVETTGRRMAGADASTAAAATTHKFDPFTQRDFYALKAFFSIMCLRGGGRHLFPHRSGESSPPFVKLARHRKLKQRSMN